MIGREINYHIMVVTSRRGLVIAGVYLCKDFSELGSRASSNSQLPDRVFLRTRNSAISESEKRFPVLDERPLTGKSLRGISLRLH